MKGVKDLLLENWGLKLTAVFLAFILWLAVHGDPGTERVMPVPVEIRNIPRNIEVTERPSSVEVTIRGSVSNLGFGQPAPTCIIDLHSAEEGERFVSLTPSIIRIPPTIGLQVVSVRPARVRLLLERILSKEAGIIPNLVGNPAPGFEVYSSSASPAATLITGPRSRIEKISKVTTESISVQGQQEPLRSFVNLNIQDSLVHFSPSLPIEVKVEIGVQRKIHTISRVPVVPDDSTVTVSPPRVTVRVLVPSNFKGSLTAADFKATVSVRNLDPSRPILKVKPDVSPTDLLDPAMRIQEILPPMVTVRRTGRS